MRVSIIVPALNEAANLPHVLPRIPHLPEIGEEHAKARSLRRAGAPGSARER